MGHFRLEKMIGRGGMGVVWSAVDSRDQKRVALKFLDDVRRDDPVSHARFLREAELATNLRHPNVVRVHAIDYTLEGTPFLVMDLLEGESLRARLKQATRLSPKECGVLLAPVAAAARAAHEAGIVHRDLKPENVFLSNEGVRVLDFGIAKRLSADEVKDTFTSTGAMLGTPAYMAPEQIFGERDIDGKVDVWALGVILYECLAGVRPTEGGVGQVLKAITSHRIVPLAERVTAPIELCRFVMSMLAMEPSDRPTMSEAEHVLTSLRDDAYEPSAAIARSETKRGGRRSVGAVAAVVAVIVLGGLAIRFGVLDRTASTVAPPVSASSVATAATATATVTAEPSREPASPSNSASATTATAAPRSTVTPVATATSTSSAPVANAEFDVVLGRVGGMGNQPTQSDVVAALRAAQPCFPAPRADEKWTVALDVTWPKGGARAAAFNARRNGVASANAPLEACAKKTFDAAHIAAPDGQDDVGGTSYVRMSVGYY
ncbi:MAG TPA: serine/threonine-protein kinase [Polyangiaceae bacterium]|nr:serine/threonine-protein kinase [Polyangiaceae bacterium]